MITKTTVEEIKRLYRQGWGERCIADMVDVSESTAVRILRGKHRHNQERLMKGQRPKSELAIYRKDRS